MNGQASSEQAASVYNKVRPGVQHLRRTPPFGHLQNCCYVLQAFDPLQSRNGGLLEVTICQTSNPLCNCGCPLQETLRVNILASCMILRRSYCCLQVFTPFECDLRPWDAQKFAQCTAKKRIIMVGDSLMRQQFQSLACLTSNVTVTPQASQYSSIAQTSR